MHFRVCVSSLRSNGGCGDELSLQPSSTLPISLSTSFFIFLSRSHLSFTVHNWQCWESGRISLLFHLHRYMSPTYLPTPLTSLHLLPWFTASATPGSPLTHLAPFNILTGQRYKPPDLRTMLSSYWVLADAINCKPWWSPFITISCWSYSHPLNKNWAVIFGMILPLFDSNTSVVSTTSAIPSRRYKWACINQNTLYRPSIVHWSSRHLWVNVNALVRSDCVIMGFSFDQASPVLPCSSHLLYILSIYYLVVLL